MTRTEQVKFIRDYTASCAEQIANQAAQGKFPEDWEGLEFKKFIAEKMEIPKGWMNPSRTRKYNNDVLINGLF